MLEILKDIATKLPLDSRHRTMLLEKIKINLDTANPFGLAASNNWRLELAWNELFQKTMLEDLDSWLQRNTIFDSHKQLPAISGQNMGALYGTKSRELESIIEAAAPSNKVIIGWGKDCGDECDSCGECDNFKEVTRDSTRLVISKNPLDLLFASTRTGWTSCITFDNNRWTYNWAPGLFNYLTDPSVFIIYIESDVRKQFTLLGHEITLPTRWARRLQILGTLKDYRKNVVEENCVFTSTTYGHCFSSGKLHRLWNEHLFMEWNLPIVRHDFLYSEGHSFISRYQNPHFWTQGNFLIHPYMDCGAAFKYAPEPGGGEAVYERGYLLSNKVAGNIHGIRSGRPEMPASVRRKERTAKDFRFDVNRVIRCHGSYEGYQGYYYKNSWRSLMTESHREFVRNKETPPEEAIYWNDSNT